MLYALDAQEQIVEINGLIRRIRSGTRVIRTSIIKTHVNGYRRAAHLLPLRATSFFASFTRLLVYVLQCKYSTPYFCEFCGAIHAQLPALPEGEQT